MSSKGYATYGLGRVLGQAEVQISRIDTDVLSFVSNIQENITRVNLSINCLQAAAQYIKTLEGLGVKNLALGTITNLQGVLNFDTDPANLQLPDISGLQSSIGAARSVISKVLHQNPPHGNVYDLGLSLGKAEGQASTGDPAAMPFAVAEVHGALSASQANAPAFHGVIDPKRLTDPLFSNINSPPPVFHQKIKGIADDYHVEFNKAKAPL